MKKKVVVVDNYDSFTYNLVQYVETLSAKTRVFLNDRTNCNEIWQQQPDGILLSPGPGTPDDAGITLEVIAEFAGKIPIFGVCLGHQSIGQAFGGKVVRARRLMHGKTSLVHHDGKTIFAGMPQPFSATRYHSLVVEPSQLPDCLEVTARTDAAEIMGLRHTTFPIEGVQFHPESFLTDNGMRLIENWPRGTMTDALPFSKVLAEVESSSGLSAELARQAFDEILEGLWTPAQISGLLIALRARPDSATIVTAAAESLRAAMVRVSHTHPKLVDTCGTGGDGHSTLNLSTGAAIMLAASGVRVAKHGNRAMSSKTGAADVLEKLGIPVTLSPTAPGRLLNEVGIAFMLAPTHHPAMRFAAPVRRELGVRTLFNCLGPLANPAGASYQLLGAYSDTIRPILAESLRRLGSVRAWVIHSRDGLDEFSPFGPTRITQLLDGNLSELELSPEDFGLERSEKGAIAGAGPDYNAETLRAVLSGKAHAARTAFVLNAAAALVVAESLSPREAAARMQQVLDSGAALDKLEAWGNAARRLAGSTP